jgi:hypothetical protein
VDPAVVSAPFITTLVDATGLVFYFVFATLILGLSRPGSQPHRPGDDALHDLGGAAVDRGDSAVGIGPGDRILGHKAVPTEQLKAPIRGGVMQFGTPPLG